MSNKMAGMHRLIKKQPEEKDVLVIYNVAKKDPEQPAEVKLAIRCIYDYVANYPVYFRVQPVMHNSRLVFSIIGTIPDQEQLKRVLALAMSECNCELVYGPNQPPQTRVR